MTLDKMRGAVIDKDVGHRELLITGDAIPHGDQIH